MTNLTAPADGWPGSTARRCSWWTTTVLRANYREFKKYLPRVQAYYAVKANPDPAIVRTLYEAGASFDVASHAGVPDRPREHQGPARQAAAGLDLGQDHLRQPDQGHRDARAAGPVQAAGHLRQPRGDPQDQAARPARRPGAAAQGAQHRRDGGAVVSKFGAAPGEAVDLIRGRLRRRARRRGHQLPRRQPVHQLRELRAGAEPGRRRLPGGLGPRLPPDEDPRHRRRLPRPLRQERQAVPRAGRDGSTPSSTACSPRTSRSSPSPAASWSPPPARWSPRSSARPSATARRATTSTTASTTPTQRHHLRPLQVPGEGVQERPDADLRRLRPHLRRPGHRSRWPRTCPTWSWATWSTARTSAPTATPRPPTSTASRRRRWCTSTNRLYGAPTRPG